MLILEEPDNILLVAPDIERCKHTNFSFPSIFFIHSLLFFTISFSPFLFTRPLWSAWTIIAHQLLEDKSIKQPEQPDLPFPCIRSSHPTQFKCPPNQLSRSQCSNSQTESSSSQSFPPSVCMLIANSIDGLTVDKTKRFLKLLLSGYKKAISCSRFANSQLFPLLQPSAIKQRS